MTNNVASTTNIDAQVKMSDAATPGAPAHGAALHGTALHGTPAHGTTAHGTPLYGTRLHSTPLHGTPLHGASVYRLRKSFAVVHFEQPGKGRIVFLPEGAELHLAGPSLLSKCFEVVCDNLSYNIFAEDLFGAWSTPIKNGRSGAMRPRATQPRAAQPRAAEPKAMSACA
jgi:hypothetical protein